MPNKTRKIAATGMLCALTYVVMAVGRVPVQIEIYLSLSA